MMSPTVFVAVAALVLLVVWVATRSRNPKPGGSDRPADDRRDAE